MPDHLSTVITIHHIAVIHFGFGARLRLPQALLDTGIRRPLFVTDQTIRACGVFGLATEALPSPSDIFHGTPPNPTIAAVHEALEQYRREGCDGLVAVGGGSVIDCAKAVALLATHDGPLDHYEHAPEGSIGAHIAPVLAVPTTAGTGSEVGRGMGITLDCGRKGAFRSRNLVPKTALYDPELTVGLPPLLTAGTGIDAFSHCLEAFISPLVNPPVDAIALSGIRRIAAYIESATKNGDDREARWHMMMGAVESGISLWKGAGYAHALAVAMDELDLHHGTLVGTVLPECIRYQEHHLGARGQSIRDALGLPADGSIARFLDRLNASIGVPGSLAELGVPHEALPAFAKTAVDTVFNRNSPVSMNVQDCVGILSRCMEV
jgi:alcohol dehydrogenase class IV